VRWFGSTGSGVWCEVASKRPQLGTYAACGTAQPQRSVTLLANSTTRVCRGLVCVGNAPTTATHLRYGGSVAVGPFRCTSLQSGIRCLVVSSGHGFLIGKRVLKRF
jgi:hypothetical protein